MFNIFIDDAISVVGFVSAVSPIKVSKKSARYFDFNLQTETEMKRAVCFSPEKHKLLSQISTEGSGCLIKKAKYGVNEDVIVNDYSAVKQTDVTFQKRQITLEYKKISEILNECPLYERVNILAVLCDVGEVKTVEIDGIPLSIRRALLRDNTGTIEMSFYGDLVKNISEETCYKLNHLLVSKYKSSRLLKTTHNTTLEVVTDHDIVVDDAVAAVKNLSNESIVCKVISVNTKSFSPKLCCPTCLKEVHPDEGFVMCVACSNMTIPENCIKETVVPIKVQDITTNQKLQLISSHELLTKCFKEDLLAKEKLARKMLLSSINLTYDKNDMIISNMEINKDE